MLSPLREYLGGIVRAMDGKLLAANGIEDHIHLAVILDQKRAVMDVLREIKSRSSGWLRETRPALDFHWQDKYAGFVVSPSVMPAVLRYIERQAEHHKKMTFLEELMRLLDAHGIEYDPRYLAE